MPMLDVQRQHMVVWKVRFGEKQNGRPAKLNNKLRITAENRSVVQAFADKYGGDVRPWEQAFEVYIPRTDLPIMFIPGQSINQWWELYKGSVCQRRCDSVTDTVSGKPCVCPSDIETRIADKNACSPMTRLTFICPEVDVLGAGALVTHGRIAAETLPQEVQKVQVALERGIPVPATLRAVQKVGAGRQYVIPAIDVVGTSYNELMSGSSGGKELSSSLNQGALPSASAPTGVVSDKSVPPALSAASSSGAPASTQQRNSVNREASKVGIFGDQLEALILDATGKYLDESDFTVNDINKTLEAIKEEGK